jgi:branched-chain amino acid aminotransferase
VPKFNENGLQIGIFPDGRKSTDIFASLKSNNYLLYAMASLYARENKWNDALVLNTRDHVADSTIANLFWTSRGIIYTTPISEGPVYGVMRNWIIQNDIVYESPVTVEELLHADEIFLTNALRGIQWVKSMGTRKNYSKGFSTRLYREIIPPLFS